MEKTAQLGIAGREAHTHEAAIPLNPAHPSIPAPAPSPLREFSAGGQRQRVMLSIVVPVFNRAEVLPAIYSRLAAVVDSLGVDAEFLFIDDGSHDNAVAVLRKLKESDGRVAIVALSRHFGKAAALNAGLEHATGNAVVVMDSNLNVPPELIPELLDRWRQGYDVVSAQRIGRLSVLDATANFQLLSRRAVDALKQLKERKQSLQRQTAWIGFRQIAVPYVCHRRVNWRESVDFNKWRDFVVEHMAAATTTLKVAVGGGLVVSLLAFVYGTDAQSLASLLLLLGGLQWVGLGALWAYLNRIADDAKRRPLYLLDFHQPATSRRATLARQRRAPP